MTETFLCQLPIVWFVLVVYVWTKIVAALEIRASRQDTGWSLTKWRFSNAPVRDLMTCLESANSLPLKTTNRRGDRKGMKVLYVSNCHAPGPSGAEISARTLLLELHRRGLEVMVLTDEMYRASIAAGWDGGVSFSFAADQQLEVGLRSLWKQFKPDVVLTQSLWSPEVIEFGNRERVPTVAFVRAFWPLERLRATAEKKPSMFVANSPTMAAYVKENVGREPQILYPLIASEDYDTSAITPPSSKSITMINPVREKGGELFAQVASRMPSRSFRAVKGWMFKNSEGPQYIEMQSPNVVVDGPYSDMRQIYSQARLLLVPSLWEEAFGRVAVEAMMNGIPVVASNRGALQWVVGEGGSVLSSRDPERWVAEIESYDDRSRYDEVSRRAQERAKTFDMERQVNQFVDEIRRLVG